MEAGKRSVNPSMSVGIFSTGNTGSPSTKTTWQPTPSRGAECAASIASSVAAARAISVVLVTRPAAFNSKIARFTPEVSPKSSAFTISLLTG